MCPAANHPEYGDGSAYSLGTFWFPNHNAIGSNSEDGSSRRIAYTPDHTGRKVALWSVAGEDKKIRAYPTANIASLAVYGLKTG